jgi:hypothetical protein
MKNDSHDASQTRKEKELSEVTIIDLDKLDDDTDIDYDKLSEEKSLTLDLKDSPTTPLRSKAGIMERVLKINWHLILLIVFVFAVIFIIYRIKNWGIKVDLDKLATTDDTEYDVEKMDNILPLISIDLTYYPHQDIPHRLYASWQRRNRCCNSPFRQISPCLQDRSEYSCRWHLPFPRHPALSFPPFCLT